MFLLYTRVEWAQCITITLSVRLRTFALLGKRLHSDRSGDFSRCTRLQGTIVLHVSIGIMGVVIILCSIADNTCLKHLNLTTQQPLAHAIPFNHIGCIEILADTYSQTSCTHPTGLISH